MIKKINQSPLNNKKKKVKQSPSKKDSSHDKVRPVENKLNALHSLSCGTLVVYQITFQCLTVLP